MELGGGGLSCVRLQPSVRWCGERKTQRRGESEEPRRQEADQRGGAKRKREQKGRGKEEDERADRETRTREERGEGRDETEGGQRRTGRDKRRRTRERQGTRKRQGEAAKSREREGAGRQDGERTRSSGQRAQAGGGKRVRETERHLREISPSLTPRAPLQRRLERRRPETSNSGGRRLIATLPL